MARRCSGAVRGEHLANGELRPVGAQDPQRVRVGIEQQAARRGDNRFAAAWADAGGR
jgi:hypothetical protein